jgi:hypothetical protein
LTGLLSPFEMTDIRNARKILVAIFTSLQGVS